jgi:hypothetical protein
MASFPVSPGVEFREFDSSSVIASPLATAGSIAGKFPWGPVGKRIRVSDENDLVAKFGKPSDSAYLDFLLAASFLAYSSALDVVRIGSKTTVQNAVDSGSAVSILNIDDYEVAAPTTCKFFARYPGDLGNSLQVVTCGTATQFSTSLPGAFGFSVSNVVTYTPNGAETLAGYFSVGDYLVVDGTKYTVAAVGTTLTLAQVYTGSTSPSSVKREWQYAYLFGSAPVTNEFHFAVIDFDGKVSGNAGFVLESATMSTVTTAKNADGSPRYYVEALKQNSSYILAGTVALTFSGNNATSTVLTGGNSAFSTLGLADYVNGYDQFKNNEEVYAPLIIGGDAMGSGAVLAKYLVQNIGTVRKDTMVFLSPQYSSVSAKGREVGNVISDRNLIGTAAYGTMDSNWKYTFDRYNNKFRWIPCCADHAGLYATTNDSWDSAAGLDASIKGAIKLAWNPTKNDRDQLYPSDVNPIYSKPGFGPILFGHKTLLGKESPLNRVPNRRILSELEQLITQSAQAMLFKVNNEATQRRFYSIVDPYLRDIKGQGGLIDYVVIADATVNTPTIVSQNKFVAKIYVKLNGFAEFILLDFTAVGANTDFTEVIVSNV